MKIKITTNLGLILINANILPLLIGIISNDKHILDIFFTISSGFV